MATQYPALSAQHIDFIQAQHLFFVASASGQEVNLSPKGYDSLHIASESEVIYLDYPGSGDRTARDIEAGGTVTIMFVSFGPQALILRLYCQGELVEPEDGQYDQLLGLFEARPELVRRLIKYRIVKVETSCGESIPLFQYQGERKELLHWAEKKANEGSLRQYIAEHRKPPRIFP